MGTAARDKLRLQNDEENPSPQLGCFWGSRGFDRVRDGLQREAELHEAVQAGGERGDCTLTAAGQSRVA